MLKILELFGGIGACSKALERLGIDYEIADYVEIDKYAVKSFNAIHNTNFEPQDITQWDKKIEVDLIMHGSPCQDFSISGKQAGGDKGSGTRSSLMYETIRIVEKLKPKYVIWENVKNLIGKKHKHNHDTYIYMLDKMGYNTYYQVLNAKDHGIPQNRERVFTISIRKDIDKGYVFPQKEELKLKLKDILEPQVDEKYYLSEEQCEKISNWKSYRNPIEEAKYLDSEYSSCLTAKGNTSNNASMLLIKNATKKGYQEAFEGDSVNLAYPNSKTRRGRVGEQVSQTLQCNDSMGVVNNDLRIRKLTPKECWRLMGFDDTDFDKASKVNSDTQLYKQAGNSIVVNVLEKIINNLLK
jgi:DNA (cytosine-5)-methyltransferase 1